jgi:hypothetical protein
LTSTPPVGHWNYLHGSPNLVVTLAGELATRLPYTQATVLTADTLVFAGNLPTIGEIGLGFERETAELIFSHQLNVVPRPVSYAWPEKTLLERTLAQAAGLGSLVAFAGDMILGHEMHLDETLAAMVENNLSLVYFAESRHQKGDWFIAKRRAPQVVLAHQFSPAEMVPLDFHAAAHNWAHLARERGIRFCYVNFFRILHATAPLEGLDYLSHLKQALEANGFTVSPSVDIPQPVPAPKPADLALTALVPAGITAAALTQSLKLPEVVAVPLALAGAVGAAALPFVEQARNQSRRPAHHTHDHDHHDHHEHNHHEHEHHEDGHHEHPHDHNHDHDHDHSHDHGDLQALYPPSYTPKLLALAAGAMTPVMAVSASRGQETIPALWAALVAPPAAAAALAAVTSGQEYYLRVEEYRGFNLDWLLPLAAAALNVPRPDVRTALLVVLGTSWLAARQRGADPLAQFDPAHALGHTHHISAAQRIMGDIFITFGPYPARKWAGLGPAAALLAHTLNRRGQSKAAGLLSFVAATGYMLGLVGFRRPERALAVTLRESLPSYLVGSAVGILTPLLRK